MKRPWLAALLNFFFMGLGTLYNRRRPILGLGMTVAAVLLTWVELQLQELLPLHHKVMFAAVFLANTVLAHDGWREAKALNAEGGAAPAARPQGTA